MKTIERIKKKQWRAKTTTSIESLPQDLIVEIVAQLVSQSATPISDLEKLQMTCKMFRAASKTKLIGQRISLKKEWNLHWWNKRRYFAILEHCAAVGNPEACFILGLENVFNLGRMSLGLCYLEKAIIGGYGAAIYTMGILLFGDHRTRQMGMQLLNRIRAVGTDTVRRDVLESVRMITMNKRSPGQIERCTNPTCGRVEGWNERQSFCSEICQWTSEYVEFYTNM
ncbi:F-box protein At2g35280-like [Elaeis guineensis]|uniref:F-box protein At2g35280-like n=1 Tax=Elaeis guineensis var. tenera TaxID=51953 RepID=UPI003C6CDDD6